MKREILFKAKRIDTGEWVEGSVNHRENGECIIHVNNKHLPYNAKIVDPETVCQYTGLKDKNGVKIFEGDKVEYRSAIKNAKYQGVIDYWVGQMGVGYRYKSNKHTMMLKVGHTINMKVTGSNIHD